MWILISELKCLKFKMSKIKGSYKRIKQIEPIQPIKQRWCSITLGTLDTYNPGPDLAYRANILIRAYNGL